MKIPQQKTKILTINNHTHRLNMFLLAGILSFLVFYIFTMNRTADLSYKATNLKINLAKENLSTKNSSIQDDVNLERLVNFAYQHGMIEVKNYDSFIEDSGVALGK